MRQGTQVDNISESIETHKLSTISELTLYNENSRSNHNQTFSVSVFSLSPPSMSMIYCRSLAYFTFDSVVLNVQVSILALVAILGVPKNCT